MAGSFQSIFKRKEVLVEEGKNVSVPENDKPLMRVLEPRILLDAAAIETALDIAGQAAHSQLADNYIANSRSVEVMPQDAGPEIVIEEPAMMEESIAGEAFLKDGETETESFSARRVDREIVFIDAGVEDRKTLIASLEPGVSVHILDADRDGVEQMAEILGESYGYSAIHVFSHGVAGSLQLGNTQLDLESINGKHTTALKTIGDALDDSGDILIYGCDFGKGDIGREASGRLAAVTGADIAASDDLTGSESLSGDWQLEVRTGEIESISFKAPNWQGILSGFTIAAQDNPVIAHQDGGVIGTAGTQATWENAVEFDNGTATPDIYDIRATLVGLSDNTAASFATTNADGPTMDDFRVVVTNIGGVVGGGGGAPDILEEGEVTVRWEIFEAGTTTPVAPSEINLLLTEITGHSSSPESDETIKFESEFVTEFTTETGGDLVAVAEDGGLSVSGTTPATNENSQIALTLEGTNRFTVTYISRTLLTNFDMVGNTDLSGFTNPDTTDTQVLDLNGDDQAGDDHNAIYINLADGAGGTSPEDVPLSIADLDVNVFDFDNEQLLGATVTLENMLDGDTLNYDIDLFTRLGMIVTETIVPANGGDPAKLVIDLVNPARISNYLTALQSITYSNSLPDAATPPDPFFDRTTNRFVTVSITDGVQQTQATTQIAIGAAGNAPIVGNNIYVEDEGVTITADAASGLLANDKDKNGDDLDIISVTDLNGTALVEEILGGVPTGYLVNPVDGGGESTLASGASLRVNKETGEFTYTPADYYNGNETFAYVVTDAASGLPGDGFETEGFVTFDIQPVANDVTLNIVKPNPATDPGTDEDQQSAIIEVSATSPDAKEQQIYSALDIPVGVILTDGTNSFTSDNDNRDVDITFWDRSQLRVLPVENSDREISVEILVTNFEVDGSLSFASEVVEFKINAVADKPTLLVNEARGEIDGDVILEGVIQPSLFDVDGSEEITDITISNIPAGAEFLVGGVSRPISPAGVLVLDMIDLPDLVFRAPQNGLIITYDMMVSATATEIAPNGAVTTSTAVESGVLLRIVINDDTEPVIAVGDTASTFTGESVTINVLDNDSIPDGTPIITEINGEYIDNNTPVTLDGGEGTVFLTLTGELRFEADPNFSGVAQFTYTVQDIDLDTDTATVNVFVEPRWKLTSVGGAVEGGTAEFVLELEGLVNQGQEISTEIILQDISTDAGDHETLASAINDSIAGPPGHPDFSFDGSRITYNAPDINYTSVYDSTGSTFVDISGTGTAHSVGDDSSTLQPLGFDFDFYGLSFDQAYISANGYMTFGAPAVAPANGPLDGSAMNSLPVIAPFWDDLTTTGANTVYTELQTNGLDQQEFVVQWQNVGNKSGGTDTATFQVILNSVTGEIRFNYNDVDLSNAGSSAGEATIGMQSTSGVADEFSYNSAGAVANGSSIVFTRGDVPTPVLNISVDITDDPDFEADEDFSLRIQNSLNAAIGDNVATVTIASSDNSAPIAVDDNRTISETGVLITNVIDPDSGATGEAGEDTDAEGQDITISEFNGVTISGISVIALSGGATVVVDPLGTITYNPNDKFSGLGQGDTATETLTYRIQDSYGEVSATEGTLTIEIVGQNQAPDVDLDTAIAGITQSASVDYEPTETAMNVLPATAQVLDPDDTDVAQINLSLGGFVQPPHESLVMGNLRVVHGSAGGTQVATVGGVDYSVAYNGGNSFTISLFGGGEMTKAQATAFLLALQYENDSNDDTPGFRTIDISVDDADEAGDPSTISIRVIGNNTPPTAGDDGTIVPYPLDEDTSIAIAVANLIANDSDADAGDTISIVAADGGANGTAVLDLVAGTITFTPAADLTGLVSFTYTLEDQAGAQATGTVFVDIQPLNDAPRVDPNGALAGENYTLDYDENAPASSIVATDGSLVDVDNATLDKLTITLTNGQIGDRLVVGTFPSALTLSIVPISAGVELTAPGTAVMTFTGAGTPAEYEQALRAVKFESLSDNPDETPRVLEIVAEDHALSSILATTTINVHRENDAPDTVADATDPFDEDNNFLIAAADLIANDTDAENDTLTLVSVQDASNGGTVGLNADNDVVYMPALHYFGPASFTYTVEDGNGGSTTEIVNLLINSVNDVAVIDLDAGTGGADYSTTYEEDGAPAPIVDASFSISDVDDTFMEEATIVLTNGAIGDVLATGALPNGIGATITPAVPLASAGPVTLELVGSATRTVYEDIIRNITFEAATEAPGTDDRTIEITLDDGDNSSNTATTTIAVTALNDAPIAQDDNSISFDEDFTRVITAAELLGNDSDPDLESFTIVSVGSPTNGTVILNGDGTISFTPTPDVFGIASFEYTIEDAALAQSTATVNMMIDAVNDVSILDLDNGSAGSGFAVTYDEDDIVGVQLVDSSLSIVDIDNADLLQATITLNDGQIGDQLVVGTLPSGMTATVTPSGGPLTTPQVITVELSGEVSKADYELALQEIRYLSTSQAPTLVSATRDVSVVLYDGEGFSNTANTLITINPSNDDPTPSANSFNTDEDTDLPLAPASLLFNDTDPDGDTVSIQSVGNATQGSVSIVGGQIIFVPTPNYHGPASFEYTLIDGNGGSATGTVSVTVDSINDAPTLDLESSVSGSTSYFTTYTEGPVAVPIADASVDFTDIDHTTLSGVTVELTNGRVGDVLAVGSLPTGITIQTAPSGGLVVDGSATVILQGTASYADYQAAIGAITFSSNSNVPSVVDRIIEVTVTDGETDSNVAVTTVEVIPINDVPVANPDGTFTFDEDTLFSTIDTVLTINDTDGENEALTVTSVGNATHGTVTLNAGLISFVPDDDYFGPASFEYTVTDGTSPATGLVNLEIAPINDAPTLDLQSSVGGSTSYETSYTEGAAPVVIADASVDFADVDHTTLSGVTVELTNGRVGDILAVGALPSGITITTAPSGALVVDGTATVTLGGSASYADYQAAIGAITFSSNSSVPSVVDRIIEVTVTDGETDSNVAVTTVEVIPINDVPVANPDGTFTFDEDTLFSTIDTVLTINDTDGENEALTVTSVGNATHGTVTLNAGLISFVPDDDYFGPASFEYTVTDGTSPATGLVNLEIAPINDAPTLDLQSSVGGSTSYETSYTEGAAPVVIADASVDFADVDHTTLSGVTVELTNGRVGDILAVGALPSGITITAAPSGALVVDGTATVTLGGSASYADYQVAIGAITFSSNSSVPSVVDRIIEVTVTDGETDSNVAVTTVEVIPVNDVPVANPDGTFTFDEDTVFSTFDTVLTINDTDGENETLTVTSVGNATHGTVTLNAGLISFVPDDDYFGPASFEYTVTDGTSSATGLVNLEIDPRNDVAELDLDLNTAGTGFTNTFTENLGPVALVDPTVFADDVDNAELVGATITLSNGQIGDELLAGALPTGITLKNPPSPPLVVNGFVTLELEGDADFATYEAALQALTFNSISQDPDTTDRIISITVNDGEANSNSAVSVISVVGVNDAPNVVDDGPFNLDEDQTFSVPAISVLFNDTDFENDSFSVISVQDGVNGTATLSPNGTITFVPDAHFHGAASFDYTVRDAAGMESTATVNLNYTSINDLPELDLNTGLLGSGHVVSYDENAPGVPLVDASLTITDVESTDLTGVSFTLVDGLAGDVLEIGTLPVGINLVGSAPSPLAFDGPLVVTLSGTASIADYQLAMQEVTFRTISENPSTVNRTVNISISDDTDDSLISTTVIGVNAENDAPVGADDGPFDVDEDQTLEIVPAALLFNDADFENDPLTLVSVQGAVNGSVVLGADQIIRFTPDPAYFGPASFTYTVEDTGGLSDTRTVDVFVYAINDAPIVDLDGTASAAVDLVVNYEEHDPAVALVDPAATIFDEEGHDIHEALFVLTNGDVGDILEVGSLPTGITAVVSQVGALTAPGTMTVTLTGPASTTDFEAAMKVVSFSSISENPSTTPRVVNIDVEDGTYRSSIVTTTVNVTATNDAPIASDDGSPVPIQMFEDVPLEFDPVNANDIDFENDTLTITEIDGMAITSLTPVTLASGASVALGSDGTTLTVTPPLNFSGLSTFTYTVSDGALADTAIVYLDISPVNDAPNALDDGPVVLVEDGSATYDPVTSNDTDVEGDTLGIVSINGQAISPLGSVTITEGSVTLLADGRTISFIPAPDFSGTSVVEYGVSDGSDVSTANISFEVTPEDDPITVVSTPGNLTMSDGEVVNLPMAVHFLDPDGDPLTFAATGLPAGLSINVSTGIISGVIDSSASTGGTYTVTITADDMVSSTETLSFDITVENTVPVAASNVTVPLWDGQAFSFDAETLFTDSDGDALTYTVTGLPAWASASASGALISGTVPGDASVFGTQSVTVEATDTEGATASVVVTLNPENVAPDAVGSIANRSLQEGAAFDIFVGGLFADGGDDSDSLTLSVTGLPGGLTFDPISNRIFGTLATGTGSVLPYVVTVAASDGQGGTASQSFSISVASVDNIVTSDSESEGEEAAFATFEDLVVLDEFVDPFFADDDEEENILGALVDISDLNGTADLANDDGLLLGLIDAIEPLQGATLPGSADGIPEQVAAMGQLAQSTDWINESGRAGNGDWRVDRSFAYAPPIFDDFEKDKKSKTVELLDLLTLETIKRDGVLLIELKNKLDVARDGSVLKTLMTLPNGKPLPEWMKLVRDGYISANPPAGETEIKLQVEVVLEDGKSLSKFVQIDVATGAVDTLENQAATGANSDDEKPGEEPQASLETVQEPVRFRAAVDQ